MLSIEVHGINETLKALKGYEPELFKKLRDDLVKDARPLAEKVGRSFPTAPPLSNWHSSGGRQGVARLPAYTGNVGGGVKPAVGGAGKNKNVVLRIFQSNAAGQVFDSAGSKSVGRFVNNLDTVFGGHSTGKKSRSRVMFGAVKANEKMIEEAVLKTIAKIDALTTKRLSGF